MNSDWLFEMEDRFRVYLAEYNISEEKYNAGSLKAKADLMKTFASVEEMSRS